MFTAFIGIWPASRLKNASLRLLGHKVHPSARIAPIVVVGTPHMVIAEGALIGPFNVIRNVPTFEMAEHSEIGQWNWISAAPFLVEARHSPLSGTFRIGAHSAVTSRHYFDCSGGVVIDQFVTIAGVRSVFMTHGIDVDDAVLDTSPIHIGQYAMVGGSCKFVLGATVPEYSVVAMGSVVTAGLTEASALYAGVPARLKKAVPHGEYAKRRVGPVNPRRLTSEPVRE